MISVLNNDKIKVSISSLGAEMQSIQANDIDYLWNGNPDYWKGHSPNLFPFVGALRNGRATSDNGPITAPKHGFVRGSELELVSSDDTHAVYKLQSNPQTLAVYPFNFEFYVKYELIENSVKVTYEIRNIGNVDMPFCVGGHPGFHVPLTEEEGDCFENYVIEMEKTETLDCPQVDMQQCLINDKVRNRVFTHSNRLRLNHVMFRGDALIFDQLQSRIIRLYCPQTGHGVNMNFETFPFVAVWTPVEDSPFVCLEPWTGMATRVSEDDRFENKIGCEILPPGEKSIYTFTLTVY